MHTDLHNALYSTTVIRLVVWMLVDDACFKPGKGRWVVFTIKRRMMSIVPSLFLRGIIALL